MVDPLIAELMAGLPALMLTGPRATGKTTTCLQHAQTVLRLDRPETAEAMRADPDAVLKGRAEPVLIDEWQIVPEVLGAVKRAVDTDFRPGRFLLAGSVRDKISAQTWPGTGRVVELQVAGLSVREILGRSAARSFIDRLIDNGPEAIVLPVDTPDLRDYLDWALRSGFPEATLGMTDRVRRVWLSGYLDQLVMRDAVELDGPRDPVRLRLLFEALAIHSAQVVTDVTLAEATGLDRKTVSAYLRLLQNLLVFEEVPAWSTRRIKRLSRSPKRFLTDSALITTALGGMDALDVLEDGQLLGRVIETFVLMQLRAEAVVSDSNPQFYHLRQQDGRQEIDVIVETPGQQIIGIEIKAAAKPGSGSHRHLVWLRDQLGDKFRCGVVLHTGRHVYRLDDRIFAVPICAIWSVTELTVETQTALPCRACLT